MIFRLNNDIINSFFRHYKILIFKFVDHNLTYLVMKQKNFLFTIICSTMSIYLFAQTARVQIIHNSADVAAQEVDIYLDDVLLLDNFEFRTATAFQDVPADLPINIKVALSNSTSSASFEYELNTTLTSGETYILVADGIISTSGYTTNDNFSIEVFDMARETANSSGNTDILVHHGSIDTESIDVNELSGPVLLENNLGYSEFGSGYISLFSNPYTINLTADDDGAVLAEYTLDLFPTYNNQAITLVASGFSDPSANSNGEPFGLFIATAAGGEMVEVQANTLNVNELKTIDVSIFPNPVVDFLNINFKLDNKTQFELFDISGRRISTQRLGMINKIDLRNYANGLYVVKLSDQTGTESFKIKLAK